MKKIVKRSLIVAGVLAGVLVIAAAGYRFMFTQGIIDPFEINSPNLKSKVLIAAQGTAFKHALVSGITEKLKQQPVYIKVIDVTSLPAVKEEEWNAVVLISTCQSAKLQAETMAYLNQAAALGKHLVLITSGSGDWKPQEARFDSISSASKTAKVDPLVTDMLRQIEDILKKTS